MLPWVEGTHVHTLTFPKYLLKKKKQNKRNTKVFIISYRRATLETLLPWRQIPLHSNTLSLHSDTLHLQCCYDNNHSHTGRMCWEAIGNAPPCVNMSAYYSPSLCVRLRESVCVCSEYVNTSMYVRCNLMVLLVWNDTRGHRYLCPVHTTHILALSYCTRF